LAADQAAVPTAGLTIRSYAWEDAIVVQCIGELTVEHSESFKAHVRSVLPKAKRIIVDLKGIHRVDSSGLGAIVGLYISSRKGACEFLLINYNNTVKNLLGLTNLLSVFEACAKTGTRLP
jgi:anti-anti-sigma factor